MLGRGHVPDRLEEPAPTEPVDPFQRRAFDRVDVPPGTADLVPDPPDLRPQLVVASGPRQVDSGARCYARIMRIRSVLLLGLSVSAWAQAGCSARRDAWDASVAPARKPLAPAPSATWADRKDLAPELHFEDASGSFAGATCELQLRANDQTQAPELAVSCKRLPDVEISFEGDTQHSPDQRSTYNTFVFDASKLESRIGGLPFDVLKSWNHIVFPIPIELRFSFYGYEPVVVKTSAVPASPDIVKAWARGVALGDPEPPDDGKMSALVLHEGFVGYEILGLGTTLSDLDWIAVARDSTTGASTSCFGGRLVIRLEADVTIYDRRTGAVMDARHFSQRAGCGGALVTTADGATQVQSAVATDAHSEVGKWIASKMSARRPM